MGIECWPKGIRTECEKFEPMVMKRLYSCKYCVKTNVWVLVAAKMQIQNINVTNEQCRGR